MFKYSYNLFRFYNCNGMSAFMYIFKQLSDHRREFRNKKTREHIIKKRMLRPRQVDFSFSIPRAHRLNMGAWCPFILFYRASNLFVPIQINYIISPRIVGVSRRLIILILFLITVPTVSELSNLLSNCYLPKQSFAIRISKQSKIHIRGSVKCIFTEIKRNIKTAHWHFFGQNKMVLAHRADLMKEQVEYGA